MQGGGVGNIADQSPFNLFESMCDFGLYTPDFLLRRVIQCSYYSSLYKLGVVATTAVPGAISNVVNANLHTTIRRAPLLIGAPNIVNWNFDATMRMIPAEYRTIVHIFAVNNISTATDALSTASFDNLSLIMLTRLSCRSFYDGRETSQIARVTAYLPPAGVGAQPAGVTLTLDNRGLVLVLDDIPDDIAPAWGGPHFTKAVGQYADMKSTQQGDGGYDLSNYSAENRMRTGLAAGPAAGLDDHTSISAHLPPNTAWTFEQIPHIEGRSVRGFLYPDDGDMSLRNVIMTVTGLTPILTDA